ncbi:glycoside hydrolase family 38 C-terminal domain-containing protein [Olivibacter domesticus]|uniref:Alpha-mannosidase n=1 Tax=Olivibacter domesticus TaxID=407022 RepID=A0A1H7H982_OLID1|nr:glycoside hydrolase family 38 C-terminal domain-containing protein [Olivibacter domesticus]SEK46844.1 alpha-mannosidase [Olivibacter domesticus]
MKTELIKSVFWLSFCLFSVFLSKAQTAYFVDGYHGGKWGHYPPQYTSFMVEQLQRHPDWKLNLEIEPVTWSWAKQVDRKGYNAFTKLIADQSDKGRIEYVNPTYGQPYLYNISGESIIRQFAYGMKELKGHFPTIQLDTYSSEEPCFTSALPQILRSFGFQYASLKNPNTCWGGYVRAYGKEMLDWIGPDGTAIPTVPRYAMEQLKDGSTWETVGNYNGKVYIESALADGIEYPVGMCLQDAGWKNGPWLGANNGGYHPTVYTTWRHYFEKVSIKRNLAKWNLSQEDIQVSLVWGSQVLQRIAQQVRKAENKLLMAEKWAAMDHALYGTVWSDSVFRGAWYPLLLAQHHDCWIVPYNKVDSLDWAAKVRQWTSVTEQLADEVMASGDTLESIVPTTLIVRNTLPYERNDIVDYILPDAQVDTGLVVLNAKEETMPTQWSHQPDGWHLLFKARVPAMGEALYRLAKRKDRPVPFAKVLQEGEEMAIETDKYTIRLNSGLGGVITSLRMKDRMDKELVDTRENKGFNELRGFFYDEQRFRSSTEQAASIALLECGAVHLKLLIKGEIAGHPFTQRIYLTKGEPRIDFELNIDWQGQPHIGQFNEEKLRAENREKAFYNDRYKLLLLFPTNLKRQHISKNGPFDVTESKLNNTFFSTWDSIKNNVLLDWVDVRDGTAQQGLALFSDHTTSYAHGEKHPLALNVQYAGKALWGRNYGVDGPTQIKYSILPHEGDWAKGQLWYANDKLVNPLKAQIRSDCARKGEQSLFNFSKPGYQLTSLQCVGDDILLRVFNAASDGAPLKIGMDLPVSKAHLEDLNGKTGEDLKITHQHNKSEVFVQMPRFGFRTIRIKINN